MILFRLYSNSLKIEERDKKKLNLKLKNLKISGYLLPLQRGQSTRGEPKHIIRIEIQLIIFCWQCLVQSMYILSLLKFKFGRLADLWTGNWLFGIAGQATRYRWTICFIRIHLSKCLCRWFPWSRPGWWPPPSHRAGTWSPVAGWTTCSPSTTSTAGLEQNKDSILKSV